MGRCKHLFYVALFQIPRGAGVDSCREVPGLARVGAGCLDCPAGPVAGPPEALSPGPQPLEQPPL